MRRREFLAGAAAGILAAGRALAEAPVVIRDPSAAGDPRYAAYADVGSFPDFDRPVAIDASGSRPRLLAWFPRSREALRLVVFSHGVLSEPSTYGGLLSHWASHGFAILAPIHADSAAEGGGTIARSVDAQGPAQWDFKRVLDDAAAWKRRAVDCMATLDAASDVAQRLGINVLADRPIVAGHDFGAYVAQRLIGAEAGETLADVRFFAAMLLSPQGAGVMGLTESSWGAVTKPLIAVTGGADVDPTGQSAQQKADCFFRSPPGNKHLAYFPKGTHTMFTERRTAGAAAGQAQFRDLRAISAAFLLAYGNYDQQAFDDIASQFFDRATGGRASMQYR
jgi:predicted dienelactone hydrolase